MGLATQDSNSENNFWTRAQSDAAILFTNDVVVQGKIVWTEQYTIGFVPDLVQYAPNFEERKSDDVLSQMGMIRGRESLVFKQFIRTITPRGEHGRQGKTGSTNTVRGLQPVAAPNKQYRKA